MVNGVFSYSQIASMLYKRDDPKKGLEDMIQYKWPASTRFKNATAEQLASMRKAFAEYRPPQK